MKTTLLGLSLIFSRVHAATITPIAYVECSDIVQEMGFRSKPNACASSNTKKAKITFMLSQKNIVAIDRKSLVIESLHYKNQDIRQNKLGIQNYKIGPFPSVSENNSFAVFSIDLLPPEFPAVQNIQGKGRVSYYTAEQKHTKTKSVDNQKPYSFKVGNTIITNMDSFQHTKDGKLKPSIIEEFQTKILEQDQTLFFVRAINSLDQIHSITVKDNGKVLNSLGETSFNNQTTYNFERPQSKKIEIMIEYWSGFKKATTAFTF